MPDRPPTLEYRNPFALRRPGILTAVASISLTYAAFGLLLGALVVWNDIYWLQEALGPQPPPPPPPATIPATGPVVLLNSYHYDPNVLIVAICSDTCNFALAVVLLTAGLKTIRERVVAARLHWLFAVFKIPVAIVSAATSWMIHTGVSKELNAAMNAVSGTGAKQMPTVGLTSLPSLFPAIIAIAYAIMLMIVLSLPEVRWYYDGLRRGTE